VSSTDAFCGWCGRKLTALEVLSPQLPISLYQGQLGEAPTVTIHLKNSGQSVASGIAVMPLGGDWMDAGPNVIEVLEPQGEADVTVVLYPDQFTSEILEGSVHLEGSGINLDIPIVLYPPLELSHTLIGSITLDAEDDGLRVEVAAESGEISVVGVDSDAEWWSVSIGREARFPFPLSKARKSRMPLDILVDTDKLTKALDARQVQRVSDGDGKFAVLTVTLTTTLNTKVPLEVRVPVETPPSILFRKPVEQAAKSDVYEMVEREVFCGQVVPKQISFVNAGDQTLVITAIEVDEDARDWLVVTGLDGLGPWEVARRNQNGDSAAAMMSGFGIEIDASNHCAGTRLKGAIRLKTNSYPDPDIEVSVEALLSDLPNLDGFVAIDFGTTNSCVVYFDRSRQMVAPQAAVVEVFGNEDRRSAPSVVAYRRLLDELRDYDIGHLARAYVDGSPSAVVQSVKRSIGTDRTFLVRGWKNRERQELKPEVVAGDLIGRLISHAEASIRRRISRCAITYPVKFDWPQIQGLRAAFEQAGVEVGVMVPEPVAAGLDYILGRGMQPAYSVLVCDLGGGTSDFSLFNVSWVEDRLDEDEVEQVVSPRLLGADTDNDFGGDDVTAAVLEEMHKQAEAQLGQDIPLLEPGDVSDGRNPALDEIGLINFFNLLGDAERIKLALSAASIPDQPIEQRLSLHDLPADKVQPEVSITLDDVNKRVRDRFAYLCQMAERLVDRARVRGHIEDVDILLLTGNASQWPLVKEMLQASFPGAQFASELAPSVGAATGKATAAFEGSGLKECVARGACLNEMYETVVSNIRIDGECYKVASMVVGYEVAGPTIQLKPVIEVGDSLGDWFPAGTHRVDRAINIQSDVGNNRRRSIKVVNPRDHVGGDVRTVKVEFMLTERQEVRVRLNAEGQEPVVIEPVGAEIG
jgi:molecular chaperone DnaK (HSP70)